MTRVGSCAARPPSPREPNRNKQVSFASMSRSTAAFRQTPADRPAVRHDILDFPARVLAILPCGAVIPAIYPTQMGHIKSLDQYTEGAKLRFLKARAILPSDARSHFGSFFDTTGVAICNSPPTMIVVDAVKGVAQTEPARQSVFPVARLT